MMRYLCFLLAVLAPALAWAQSDLLPPTPSTMHIFIGTNTGPKSQGIYRATFNPADGALTDLALVAEVKNPSFITLDAKRRVLYAISESAQAQVGAYTVRPDGSLELLVMQPLAGRGPCHVSISNDGKTLLVSHYGSGAVESLPITPDGSIGPVVSHIQHTGSGPNTRRQEKPHTHSAIFHPTQPLALVCDLGTDEVIAYRVNPDASIERLTSARATGGAGPRMSTWSNDGQYAYVANELDNTLSIYQLIGSELKSVASVDVRRADVPDGNSLSQVELSQDNTIAYVSIRDVMKDANQTDAIAVVDVKDPANPVVREHTSVGPIPRHFKISPDGKWMLVANQNGHAIDVFAIDPTTGALTKTSQRLDVGSPTCVVFDVK